MAKVLSNGLLSGRLGKLVYFVINGRQCVRTYVVPKNPQTPAQCRHRTKMKTCGEFLSQFKSVIMIGYQSEESEPGEYNEASQYHLANAMEEIINPDSAVHSFEIHYEKVKLSRGLIHSPEITGCIRTGAEISLTWNPKLGKVPNRQTDALAIVAYTPGRKVITNFIVGTRSDGQGTLLLPGDYTSPVHLWVFYWNGQKNAKRSKENVSGSEYLGNILSLSSGRAG